MDKSIKIKDEDEFCKLSEIFENLPQKVRENLWKKFFEKAPKNMSIIEFLKQKIENREIKIKRKL